MKSILALIAGALGLAAVSVAVMPVMTPAPAAAAGTTAKTILAGGCFWCLEHDFRQLPGIVEAVSGYSGGGRPDANYDNYHDTDAQYPVPHTEVVEVTYDTTKLSYDQVLNYFFRHVDATDGGGQFCDRGPAYRPVIYFNNEDEQKKAEAAKAWAGKALGQPIAVDVLKSGKFWPAEEYHQDYAEKNPVRYKFYRWNCGRDQRVKELWSMVPTN